MSAIGKSSSESGEGSAEDHVVEESSWKRKLHSLGEEAGTCRKRPVMVHVVETTEDEERRYAHAMVSSIYVPHECRECGSEFLQMFATKYLQVTLEGKKHVEQCMNGASDAENVCEAEHSLFLATYDNGDEISDIDSLDVEYGSEGEESVFADDMICKFDKLNLNKTLEKN